MTENKTDTQLSPELQTEKTAKKRRDVLKKTCQVLHYDKRTKTLDLSFDRYGIRLHNVPDCTAKSVEVQYQGSIGSSDFKCGLVK